MVLLLQTTGACTAVHILTPGFVEASQGFWDLGGRVIYFQGSMRTRFWGGGVLGSRDLTNAFLGAGEKGNFLPRAGN